MTDAEIDELVVAEAHDPDAWSEPIVVPPAKSKRPEWIARAKHLDVAAKLYVASVLHRLGLDAKMTFAHQGNVDITVVQESGRALTLDVKTLSGAREWPVADFRAREGHFLVFVWYSPEYPLMPPTVYIVASQRLKEFLSRRRVATLALEVLADEMNAQEAWQQLAPAA